MSVKIRINQNQGPVSRKFAKFNRQASTTGLNDTRTLPDAVNVEIQTYKSVRNAKNVIKLSNNYKIKANVCTLPKSRPSSSTA